MKVHARVITTADVGETPRPELALVFRTSERYARAVVLVLGAIVQTTLADTRSRWPVVLGDPYLLSSGFGEVHDFRARITLEIDSASEVRAACDALGIALSRAKDAAAPGGSLAMFGIDSFE